MSRLLWRPSTDSDGIPFETLCTFVNAFLDWREQYLRLVGVSTNFEREWDFVSVSLILGRFRCLGWLMINQQAVSSCASDATYHVMWIILFNAVDDFGIKELNNSVNNHSVNHADIAATKRKVAEEAVNGALRIAALAGVLASNGYLVSLSDIHS